MKKTIFCLFLLFNNIFPAEEVKYELPNRLLIQNHSDQDVRINLYYRDLKKVIGKNYSIVVHPYSTNNILIYDKSAYRIYRLNMIWFYKESSNKRYIEVDLSYFTDEQLLNKILFIKQRDDETLELTSDDLKIEVKDREVLKQHVNDIRDEKFQNFIKAVEKDDQNKGQVTANKLSDKFYMLITKIKNLLLKVLKDVHKINNSEYNEIKK